MAYYLPSGGTTGNDDAAAVTAGACTVEEMADLKIFWGPEICRLEYLIHLLDTGRVKDEHWRASEE